MQPIPLSLYVHVPWCVRKCPYCDFNSHETSTIPERAYVDQLLRDLDAEVREFFTSFTKTVRAAQLYVQGNPLLHQFGPSPGPTAQPGFSRRNHLGQTWPGHRIARMMESSHMHPMTPPF